MQTFWGQEEAAATPAGGGDWLDGRGGRADAPISSAVAQRVRAWVRHRQRPAGYVPFQAGRPDRWRCTYEVHTHTVTSGLIQRQVCSWAGGPAVTLGDKQARRGLLSMSYKIRMFRLPGGIFNCGGRRRRSRRARSLPDACGCGRGYSRRYAQRLGMTGGAGHFVSPGAAQACDPAAGPAARFAGRV